LNLEELRETRQFKRRKKKRTIVRERGESKGGATK